jgi:cytochrome P450
VNVEFNPWSPDFRADPYPHYTRLRTHDPVHFVEHPGMWVLTRYADVAAVLRDERFSSRRALFERILATLPDGQVPPILSRATRTMLFSDPPDHTRLRNLVNKAFTPRVVEGLRPRLERIVAELIDAVGANGRMDLIEDVALPLPIIAIAELLGVPAADRAMLKQWSDDIAVIVDGTIALDRLEALDRGARGLEVYLRGVFAERRAHPRDDLVSGLVMAREHGDVLSEEELLGTCMLLLVAGHETTVNLIGNGMLALLRHPEAMARLRDDRSLSSAAIEELLRYDSPVQLVTRTAREDLEIGGKRIAKGQEVVLVLGAANRDPARFVEPDRLDLARVDNRHLAFGHGIHFCLGAPLARLEAQITIGALLRRLPRLHLVTAAVEWSDGFVLRGLKALPLAF